MLLVTSWTILEEARRDFPDAELSHVCYAIRKLRLEPIGQAGIAKVYRPSAIEKVKGFLGERRQPAAVS